MYYVGNAEHVAEFEDALGGNVELRFRRLRLDETLQYRGEISQIDFSADQSAAVAAQEDCFLRAGRSALAGVEPGCFCRPDGSAVLPGDEDWRSMIVDSGAIDHLLVKLGRYLTVDLYNSAKMLDKKKCPLISPCSGGGSVTSSGG